MALSSSRVVAFRLTPGQELVREMTERCQHAGLRAAFVVTCVGSIRKCRLRLAATPNGETSQFLDSSEFMEICSLVGTISTAGPHLHVTLGRVDGSTLSGHVVSMEVFTTAEVVLGEAEGLVFERSFDESTGFNELVVRGRDS